MLNHMTEYKRQQLGVLHANMISAEVCLAECYYLQLNDDTPACKVRIVRLGNTMHSSSHYDQQLLHHT